MSGQSTQHQGILPDVSFPELYDRDQIGESSLEDAMPWDMIQPAVYDASSQLQPLLPELQLRHEDRTQDNVDFNYYRALAQKGKEASMRTHLSLNETKRRAEKAKDDQWRLDLENSLRAAKGKVLADSLDHLDDLVEAENEAKQNKDNAEISAVDGDGEAAPQVDSQVTQSSTNEATEQDIIEPVEDDAMLEEAGKVLLDLIGLSTQVAQLGQVPQTTVAAGLAPALSPRAADASANPSDG